MRQSYLVAAWMIGMVLVSGAAMAQSDPGRIPNSAVGATDQVSEKDQQHIVAYIEYWVKQLQSGQPEVIATARGKLTEAYAQGGTEVFVNFYDQALASRIGAGMNAKDVAGRINTLIVARNIRNERVAEVIKQGLKDESPAVAYPAAVAAESVAKNGKVASAVKFGLRGPLMEAIKKEKSPYVLGYLYTALIAIDDPAGWDAVLVKINERITAHVTTANAGIEAETDGLRALYNRLVGGSAGLKVNDKTLQLFTLVCVRYLDYALNQASAGEATNQLVDVCDFGSNWAADQLVKGGAKFKVPSRIKGLGDLEKKLMLGDWRKVLAGEPFKYAEAEIALPKKP